MNEPSLYEASAVRLSADRARLVRRLLRQTEQSVAAGVPGMVALQGDAGQGKSTVLAAVVDEGRGRGRTVVSMAGGDLSAGMPYGALYDMVTDPANALSRGTRRLAEQLATFQPSTSPLAVAYAIGSWLADLGREMPAVVLVDDADLVDEDSLRVLAYAVTRYAPATSVVLGLTRPVPLLERLQVPVVHLRDLRRHDAVSLAVGAGASAASAHVLVTRLGGNPLALIHAAPWYAEVSDDAWPQAVPVASRLEHDVEARLDPLDPQARRVLAGAAVTGEGRLDLLALYVESDRIDEVVEGLEQSGLVTVRGDRLRWRRVWMSAAVAGRYDGERRERLTAVLHRGSGPVVVAAGHDLSELLTVSERRVVDVIVGGASVKEAADQLYLSARTVGSHLSSAYRKLGIHSRSQLAALMLSGDGTNLAVAV